MDSMSPWYDCYPSPALAPPAPRVQTEYGRYLVDGELRIRLDSDGKIYKR